jgi:hypothetical protein
VLASAYRDGKRSGPLFIGTVTADWSRLSPPAQKRSADEILAKLGPSGVRELMLYDSANRLVVHQATSSRARIAN